MVQPSSYQTEETKSIVLPLVFALAIPFLLGLIRPGWLDAVLDFLLVFFILLPFWCVIRTFTNWANGEPFLGSLFKNFLPAFLDVQGVSGAPLKKFAWVTIALIFVNTSIFLMVPKSIVDQWVFPPYGNPSDLHIVASIFSTAFLHANFPHLLGNMMFLWVLGSTLESRIGQGNFVMVYAAGIVMSTLMTMILLIFQSHYMNSLSYLANYHSLGASGAVTAVMGCFIVRCYFTRIQLNMPILVLPLIANPIKVQSLVLVGLFFALDLNGSADKLIGDGDRINHWAHVGGYLTGFCLGYLMRLHREAAEESVKQKAEQYAAEQSNDARATKLYREVLERHPDDEKALWHFFRLHQNDPEKQQEFFVSLLQVLLKKGLKQALELMDELFPRYCQSVPGDLLFRFGLDYYGKADFFKARVCLEIASEKDGPWRAKSMLKLAEVMACQGNESAADEVCSQVMREFSDTAFSKQANKIKQQISG